MKFTFSWLKRHLDTDADLDTVARTLTAIGLEVESIHDRAAQFAPFTVAYVERAEKHPDADRLKVCMVKTSTGTLQVVCGAPNARTGMKGIFAPAGSYIPGTGITLKKGVIRGAESNGMLVSEREMGLSEEHEGIIEVDDKFEIGTPMAQVFGLEDPVIEINLTPNRADCAGVRGIARDLAAAGLGRLIDLPDAGLPAAGKNPSPVSVKIENTEGCPVFFGRHIRGVKNGPSPAWLQTLLKSIGLRPISALVDVTNFLTYDLCRPLHVYDAAKLKGNIAVRRAAGGEVLAALNDKTYTLPQGAVTICDDSGVIGLGGIIGGVSTGCDAQTTDVFLEAALFNPSHIAQAGRALQINSDARYRFERGVDPAFVQSGIDIATRMILDICGGTASDVVVAGAVPDSARSVSYHTDTLKQIVGVDLAGADQVKILTALGFGVSGNNPYQVSIPSWRGDIDGKADLAEEVIRIHGFDSIPATSVRSDSTVPGAAETVLLSRARRARSALAARGMMECVTWSFMDRAMADSFGANDNAALRLKNPISADLDTMRPSILPNLLASAGRNHDMGYPDAALFEIGPVFHSPKPDDQPVIAAGIRMGQYGARDHADANAARPVDAFDAKGDAIDALEACGAPVSGLQITRDAPAHYHPGRSGTLRLGPVILAHFGEIHPGIIKAMDLKSSAVGFEIFLQNIPTNRKKAGTEKPLLALAALQPVRRDFAFLVSETTAAENIIKAIRAADKTAITDARVFDVYTGKGVEPGQKSVAVEVTIQPQGQSLTDEALAALSDTIVGAVVAKTGGRIRG